MLVNQKKKTLLSLLFLSTKKKVPETELSERNETFTDAIESPKPLLTLEYIPKPEKPPVTASDFRESPSGKKITQTLKNLVNEIHAANPNKKCTKDNLNQRFH